MSHIICNNLVKIYKQGDLETVALSGLDLTIAQGEMMGIVGASGSGKSTLMNILGGLDRPSAGQVRVGTRDLINLPDRALIKYRRSEVGFVWQQSSRNLLPFLNVRENVRLPMMLAGNMGAQARKRADALIETVGLADRSKHRLVELSGGEQQRVALSVALANEPQILLADEPTGELDTETALSIYATFQALNERFNMTTLIVSHDPTIARHVDRVVNIRDGQLASEMVRSSQAANGDTHHDDDAIEIEERIVVDATGRLQIPQDYLERYDIHGHVQLKLADDGILIQPLHTDNGHSPPLTQEAEATPAPPQRARWLRRFGRRGDKE